MKEATKEKRKRQKKRWIDDAEAREREKRKKRKEKKKRKERKETLGRKTKRQKAAFTQQPLI